ncbi:MAG: nitrilase, partial [Solirubrobacteraceae bacterium]|nr:nitrilase [Solirubrobacteraceae bacterium]
ADGDARVGELLRSSPQPASMILDPNGDVCAGPLVGEEGIVYAEIDIAASIEPKQAHDIIGYYQRFDLFSLRLDQRPQRPIELLGDGDGAQHDGVFADAGLPDGAGVPMPPAAPERERHAG